MKYLVVGWKVTHGLEPQYWLSNSAKSGGQSYDDLITVPAEAMGTHTVIIGQSGSGKSYFLGRLVEEILTNTKARCVILDPNSDFGKVHEIQEASFWTKGYNPVKRTGHLLTEKSRKEFEAKWADKQKKIYTASQYKLARETEQTPYIKLRFWWPSLSAELLSGEEPPAIRSQLHHCHAFVQAVGHLTLLKALVDGTELDPIEESEKLYKLWLEDSQAEKMYVSQDRFSEELGNFDIEKLSASTNSLDMDAFRMVESFGLHKYPEFGEFSAMYYVGQNLMLINSWMERAKTALQYVSEDVGRFYFGKASEYKTAGILSGRPELIPEKSDRLVVVDLPSLANRSLRNLAINAFLKNEWERSRAAWELALERREEEDRRIPTFVVMDEAHNFIPAQSMGEAEAALREQFRTIAAEGRKYGLYLILASQRPDKLDPMVTSEAENKALMKLDSNSILELTCKNLGMEDIQKRTLEKCLEFEKSRVLLAGRWSPEPRIMYCAARRTVEGGRNLRARYWAEP